MPDHTGQRRDDPGLLFYNARYYDPAIGRFISADTVVPGNASGGMDGVALRPLTVAFHEPGFIATLNGEGANADKLHWDGPVNPQALNRCSYVMNNPMRWTDPSGHTIYLSSLQAEMLSDGFAELADAIEGGVEIADLVGVIADRLSGPAGLLFKAIAGGSELFGQDVGILRKIAIMIDEANEGHSSGVAITATKELFGNAIHVMNRSNGVVTESYQVNYLFYIRYIPAEVDIGRSFGDTTSGGYVYTEDIDGSVPEGTHRTDGCTPLVNC